MKPANFLIKQSLILQFIVPSAPSHEVNNSVVEITKIRLRLRLSEVLCWMIKRCGGLISRCCLQSNQGKTGEAKKKKK